MKRFILAFLLLFSFLGTNAYGQITIISNEQNRFDLSSNVTHYRDAQGDQTIESVQSQSFQAHDPEYLSLGFSTDTIWLKLDFQASINENREWILEINHPLLDEVTLFYQKKTSGPWFTARSGDGILADTRDLDLRTIAFDINKLPNGVFSLFLRVKSESSMLFPITLVEKNDYFTKSSRVETGFGLFYGSLIFMALFNLALYFSIRDPIYVLYTLAVSSTVMFQATLSGHASYYLLPQAPGWTNQLSLYSLIGTICFGILFSIRFLNTKTNMPYFHYALLATMAAGLLLAPMDWFFGYSTAISLGARFSVVAGLIALITGIWSLRKHVYSAKFYVLARTGFCIGSILTAGRQLGLFENSFLTEHGMRMGGLAEALLLAFALSDRYKQLRAEKEQAQAQTAEELRRLDTLKDEILANTSHELRTPLHGIIGVSESMLDGAAGKLNKDARHNLSMIASSSKRLAGLVDDILDFSRLKTKDLRLDPKPLDLRVAVDLVVTLMQPLLRNRPITLKNNIKANTFSVYADENRLQQILNNLIGNAIKFTDQGEIVISAKSDGSQTEVEIKDTGIGISSEDLGKIFDSFQQAEGSQTRLRGGTGLGLSVTKQLVELQGGDISVSSELDVGSNFKFTIPNAPDNLESQPQNQQQVSSTLSFEEHGAPSQRAKIEGQQSTRILVVDDEPVNQQVLANQLGLENYQVDQALNGEEALSLISRGQNYDLVLLDVMMPRMSGYEVCEKIRLSHMATELPVIMVTAKSQTEDMVAGLNVGANDFISKPFTKQELLARIKTQLNLLKINTAYGNFVPQDFLRHLGKESIIDVELGDNVELEMAILWSDIRDFTSLTENMTPGESFDFINSYYNHMGPIIRNHSGFVNSFIGDAIMALFVKGADSALEAALASLDALEALNAGKEAYEEEIRAGFAIHIGSARLGIVGEEKRRQGEVFSDAVNLTNRLEGLTKTYGSRLIISAEVKDKLKRSTYSLRKLDKVKVKGRKGEIEIFEVLNGLQDQSLREDTLDVFEAALTHLEGANYDEARRGFQEVISRNPNDLAAQLHFSKALKPFEP